MVKDEEEDMVEDEVEDMVEDVVELVDLLPKY